MSSHHICNILIVFVPVPLPGSALLTPPEIPLTDIVAVRFYPFSQPPVTVATWWIFHSVSPSLFRTGNASGCLLIKSFILFPLFPQSARWVICIGLCRFAFDCRTCSDICTSDLSFKCVMLTPVTVTCIVSVLWFFESHSLLHAFLCLLIKSFISSHIRSATRAESIPRIAKVSTFRADI